MPAQYDFLEELEILADQRKSCEIIFRNENGARTVVRDRITGIYDREGKILIYTASGLEINLNNMLQVDGKTPSNFS